MRKDNVETSEMGTGPPKDEEDEGEIYEFEHAWFYIAGTDIPQPKDEERISQSPSPEEKAAWDAQTYKMEHAWIYLAGTNIPESDDEDAGLSAHG